ncbi:MAG: DnaJ domain-containing protein [Nitratireductor sp.]|nr:DnaJ domain-containing protein [Nitratireductor sp.]MCC0021535.1 DnaJ domain-containing protein [Nitratireductor sp.]
MIPIYLLVVAGVLFGLASLFVAVPASTIAAGLRRVGPLALIVAGGFLTLRGGGVIGLPMIAAALALWRASRPVRGLGGRSGNRQSTVRTAAIEMLLDLDTGEMDGIVLTGRREGEQLSRLDTDELLDLHLELSADGESRELLETYLDRRTPGWRDDAHANDDAGQGSPAASGAMTKQEAYQVLGLEPGASEQEIRQAHRRLMKRVHPDSGGSDFLAARINSAKDLLLR